MDLEFKTVSFAEKEMIDRYAFRYGERSCQHSFVSMIGHSEKYGDAVYEKDGWLYYCRENLETDQKRFYLCPLGDREDIAGFTRAIGNILEDAHKYGKRARFETVTKSAAAMLESCFPGRFDISPCRDFYEYIYSREKLVKLPGKKMAKRRYQVNACLRYYQGRLEVDAIKESDIPEIKLFQEEWLRERYEEIGNPELLEENGAIMRELDEFSRCGLMGIIIRLDDEVVGYAYGVCLTDDSFDILVEKGNRDILHIYRLLKRELPAHCDEKIQWINWEEDVGDPGLRQIKTDYYPDMLMEKFIVEELCE